MSVREAAEYYQLVLNILCVTTIWHQSITYCASNFDMGVITYSLGLYKLVIKNRKNGNERNFYMNSISDDLGMEFIYSLQRRHLERGAGGLRTPKDLRYQFSL